MKYTLHENLSETCGTVSNLHGFIHRYNDTGFSNKWTGYWSPPYKYLDYFAFKINGVWLDGDTLDATEYGEKFVFHHSTDSLNIRETVECPEGVPGFKVKLEIENTTHDMKAVQTKMEPGVDIRNKFQDLGPEEYAYDISESRLMVEKNNRKLVFSSNPVPEFDRRDELKTHYPGEKQRCFIPGDLVYQLELEPGETKIIEIDISTDNGSFDSLESREQSLELEEVGWVFKNSIDSMENLVYDRNGKGVIAGHPWFQSYWARDSFWTLLGLIDAGYFELSHEILENYVEKGLDSRIMLDGNTEDHGRSDTSPLFIIAADKLRRHYRVSDSVKSGMDDAMESLELDGNIVDHDAEGTWMDTLERPQAVDIQSLWLEAAEIMDDEVKTDLREGLEQFKDVDYMKDYLDEDSPETVNPAVPLMFGHADRKDAETYLEKLNAEFSSRFGARTRSFADPGYDSSGYHTGSVWGLTTGWAAAANLRHGKETKAVNLLEKFAQFLDSGQLGALPEIVDAENGENLGCLEQAWSAGLIVHVVDSYLLGIKVEDSKVVINPPENFSGVRKGKRVGEDELDLEFSNGKATVLNDPDIEVEIIN